MVPTHNTFGLLLEAIRHKDVAGFGAMIFRRESVQITSEGGLWDTASSVYPMVGGRPFRSPRLGFTFGKAKVTFGHLTRDLDVLNYQGAQIALIGFDELTHFSRYQFFYMLSRNRSTCGVRPYVRATTNPDADSWVAELIDWWIDPRTGFPIPDRAGVVRWFVRVDDCLHWGDSPKELAERHDVSPIEAKSLTFIPAKVTDNPILMRSDPGYQSNLKALSRVERERLLEGNWRIRPAAGMYFPRHAVNLIDSVPCGVTMTVRSWDLAATERSESNPKPSATAGVKIGRMENGRFVVLHATQLFEQAHKVRSAILALAAQDGFQTRVTIPQDPGQAGKDQSRSLVSSLAGYPVAIRRPSRDKVTRAEPFAAQWQAGNVDIVRGPWNGSFLDELEAFPDGVNDDQVDAAADAFAELLDGSVGYAGALKRVS
jgi:predicted phage terminase large subunit-like protein